MQLLERKAIKYCDEYCDYESEYCLPTERKGCPMWTFVMGVMRDVESAAEGYTTENA